MILFYLLFGVMLVAQLRVVANRLSNKWFSRYLKEQIPKSISEEETMKWRKTSGMLQLILTTMLSIAMYLNFYKTHLDIATVALVLAIITLVLDVINTKSKIGVFLLK